MKLTGELLDMQNEKNIRPWPRQNSARAMASVQINVSVEERRGEAIALSCSRVNLMRNIAQIIYKVAVLGRVNEERSSSEDELQFHDHTALRLR